MLHNEIYIGTYVFGRCFNNLGRKQPAVKAEWIRVGVLDPLVPPELFRIDKSGFAFAVVQLFQGAARRFEKCVFSGRPVDGQTAPAEVSSPTRRKHVR